MEDRELIERCRMYFTSTRRLASHLDVSPSTVARWRDGETKLPGAVRVLLLGYLKHPERVGEDFAMMEGEQ